MDGWMGVCLDGWVGGWMDGWIDHLGRMAKQSFYNSSCNCLY